MKEIKVIVKNVYGEDKVYPACPDSISFAAIAGQKTLTPKTMQLIKNLGYEIKQITNPL